MKIQTPKIVQGQSWTVYLWALVPLLLALVYWVATLNFEREGAQVESELWLLKQTLVEREEKIQVLEAERQSLLERIASVERASQIDREAMRQVQEELNARQKAQVELQQELSLLRGIVDNGVQQDGLYIQGFKLQRESIENAFRFQFTISKALKKAGTATGWIYLTLEGEMAGEAQLLALDKLTETKDGKLKMKFRHFQDVEGTIQLPAGFVPRSVLVEVKPKSKRLSPIKKRFDWLVVG